MMLQAIHPKPAVLADSSKAAHPSVLPASLQRIAQAHREFLVYDDGWRGWSYRYSEVDPTASRDLAFQRFCDLISLKSVSQIDNCHVTAIIEVTKNKRLQ